MAFTFAWATRTNAGLRYTPAYVMRTDFFVGRFVVTCRQFCPTAQVFRGGKLRHIVADLGNDCNCRIEINSGKICEEYEYFLWNKATENEL